MLPRSNPCPLCAAGGPLAGLPCICDRGVFRWADGRYAEPMKFVGGSRHGADAPTWVQQLVLGGWMSIEVEEVDNGGWAGRPGPRPVETYHVRTWHFSDGRPPVKFLAIAGKDREYIESLAAPMFRKMA